jgi:hypothetical protein
MKPFAWVLPLAGIIVVGSVPLVRYAQKSAAEDHAARVLRQLHQAQEAFRAGSGGAFASDWESLAAPCGATSPSPLTGAVAALADDGYRILLRAAAGAAPAGADCHGRPLVSDYYLAAYPGVPGAAGQRAFAMRGDGRIYLFYDGVAPLERDMGEGGLATPLDQADEFKIP